ncbi:hypothetical protein N4R57_10565 [Rhodobacteraceae bacterium D3-12]|nr:hypothetical protein N4R57_10565 [Rhodobacteraceae bacterium D3-12]
MKRVARGIGLGCGLGIALLAGAARAEGGLSDFLGPRGCTIEAGAGQAGSDAAAINKIGAVRRPLLRGSVQCRSTV